jgi:hypothetical protein
VNASPGERPRTGGSGWQPSPAPRAVRHLAPKAPSRTSWAAALRTSRRTRLLAALALIVVCALAVPVLARSLTPKSAKALAAAQDLPPGTTITPGDLAVVTASGPSGALVSAADQSSIIGRTVRVEVPAGALLDTGDFGSFPPIGSSIVPVSVKPGQYPANLQPGQSVAVFPLSTATTPTQPDTPQQAAAVSGTVTQIAPVPEDGTGQVVIDLDVANTAAPEIAQAPAVVLVGLDARGDTP